MYLFKQSASRLLHRYALMCPAGQLLNLEDYSASRKGTRLQDKIADMNDDDDESLHEGGVVLGKPERERVV